MSKLQIFLLSDTVILLIAARLIFKNFQTFKKSVYWLMHPNIISILRGKWLRDLHYSFKFEIFLALSAFLIFMNYLLFKYIF